MKIERVTKQNISKILELSKDFIEEHHKISKIRNAPSTKTLLNQKKKILENNINKNRGIILAIKENDIYIGYIFAIKGLLHIRSLKSKAYISDLFIKKDFRKKGIAKKLIKECITWCKREKINEIFLDVDIHNLKAKQLYKNLKFKEQSIKLSKKLK